jgi:hypothetical protein
METAMELYQVRRMMVGELLDLLASDYEDDDYEDNKTKMEEVLCTILSWAEVFYCEGNDYVRGLALKIAGALVDEDIRIDKDPAKDVTHEMAVLANTMLNLEEARDWDFSTRIALDKIQRSEPELAGWPPLTA